MSAVVVIISSNYLKCPRLIIQIYSYTFTIRLSSEGKLVGKPESDELGCDADKITN